jgi:hypothetical protein
MMSLCDREQRQLRGIEADLLQSDSHLAAMLETFGRLYRGQDMPAPEQVPSRHDRDRRAVTRIAEAIAVAALALSILFSALTLPPRSGAPASGHRPPSPSAPGHQAGSQQNPAGYDRQPPRRRPMTLKGVSDTGHGPRGGIGMGRFTSPDRAGIMNSLPGQRAEPARRKHSRTPARCCPSGSSSH